jgi:hypothetical protein
VRKITRFGLSAAALGALGWIATAPITAQAQPAPEGTTAPPAAAPAAPAAPEAAPAAPADAAPAAAPAPDAAAPAEAPAAAPAKKMHHHHAKMAKMSSKGVHRGGESDAAVEDLNAKSLSAAKSGTSFAPATTPDKAPGKTMKTMKAKHHHHHMMMKKAAAAADAPAPDATPAPADTSK